MLDSLDDKRNSIGYTTWSSLYSTIKNNNVKVATIVNVRPDKFISTLPSWIKTLFDYNHVYTDSTFHTLQNLTENNELYPFIYFQNIVMNKLSLVTRSCCQIQESLGFIDFLLDYNYDMDQGTYGYFSLPTAAVKHVRSSLLPLIMCDGSQSYKEFKNQETLEQKAKRERLIMIIIPSALGIVLIAVTMVFGVYFKRVKLTQETFWIINSSEIHFDKAEKSEKCNNKSALSIHSRASEKGRAPSLNTAYCCGEKFEGRMGLWTKNKTRVMLTPIEKIKPLNSWKRCTKALVGNLCTSIGHNNVSSLYGISSVDGKSYSVNQLCPKGTLNYVLSMCSYSLSHDIKYSLAYDVIQGMNYLHKKGIVHGQLTSFSCEVDGMWVVKLANWSHCSVKSWEPDENCVDNMTEIDDNVTIVKRLYVDPEAVPGLYTFPVDVYSYGMLLVEIFTQKTPFFEELEHCVYQYSTLLQNKSNRIYNVPTMSTVVVPPDVQSLISMLIRADGVSRPSSMSILNRVQDLRGNSEKSVADIVMQTLESYVLELEDKVVERTSAMKNLLNQLLPPQIASKFIQGQLVEPEFFECASILFSDVVGFTTISARSTPIQVMSFLNELWKEFDQTVERFDVYKIDTIGDAYMVASGLPDRNGINHCKCVADLSLALIRLAETFTISHLGDEKLKIRIGINSGPVTAGIVGFKMPQYCVFGDAVNTASRMESTSMPFKIQVSEYFHSLMADYFPTYRFEYRGETEIKGKGNMKTYWLL